MPQLTKITCLPSNLHRYNSSTLFQFILTEFFTTHAKIEVLKDLTAGIDAGNLQEKDNTKILKRTIHRLLASMADVLERSFIDRSVYSWHCNNGSLTKLAHYCSLWEYSYNEIHKQILKRETRRAWLLCLELQGMLCQGQLKSRPKELLTLRRLMAKLKLSMSKVMREIVSILSEFSRDENVVFFILRHRQEVESIFGACFVAKWLKKSYIGLDKATSFLQKRFAKRGFHWLIPIVVEKIQELKYSCPP